MFGEHLFLSRPGGRCPALAAAMLIVACGADPGAEAPAPPPSTEERSPPSLADEPEVEAGSPELGSLASLTTLTPADCTPELATLVALHVLAHAASRVPASALDGCLPEAARCQPTSTEPVEWGRACTLSVEAMDGWVRAMIRPRASGGAPEYVELNLDADGVRRTHAAASTWGVSRDGSISVRGLESHSSHTHGGGDAHISDALFVFRNDGVAAAAIAVAEASWVTAVGSTPLSATVAPSTVAPGAEVEVRVSFPSQDANAYGPYPFSARVVFDVDGESIEASAEEQVSARTPVRR